MELEAVRQAVFKAMRGPGTSKLTTEAIETVGGYTSPNIRHLLNNLGALATSYYEIGTHRGSTLISATYGNSLKSSIGCDNWSQFNETDQPRVDCLKNCERLIGGKYKLLEKDCFTVTQDDIPEPIDLFFSDGNHSFECQSRAIGYYRRFFDRQCIIVVDDFSWHDTNAGTMEGIQYLLNAEYKVEFCSTLFSGTESDCGPNGWWNGLGVFVVKK